MNQLFNVAIFILSLSIHTNGKVTCPITERHYWNAKAPKKTTPFNGKPSIVLIKQVAKEIDHCDADLVAMQTKDMEVYKHDDIDCSFVMTNFGVLCEGRGWNNSVIGDKTLVLCVTGVPKQHSSLSAVKYRLKTFFQCPEATAHLDPKYQIITLRDTNPLSKNPGDHLYDFIKKLPHYERAEASNVHDSLVKEGETMATG